MAGSERQRRGLPVGIAEIKAVRQRWAALSNQAFEAAGLQVRIDHRSLRAQGIDREPRPHIPAQAFYMERRGLHSHVAERIRERYRARVEARLARAAGPTAAQPSAPGIDLEQVRRQAREAWLELRDREPDGSTAAQNDAYIKESLDAGQAGREHEPHSVAAMEREAADQDLGL
jgi:hypothetical protein